MDEALEQESVSQGPISEKTPRDFMFTDRSQAVDVVNPYSFESIESTPRREPLEKLESKASLENMERPTKIFVNST